MKNALIHQGVTENTQDSSVSKTSEPCRSSGHNLRASSRSNPCPVCGRTKDGDCRISDDLVLCHKNLDHRPGKYTQNGWAFVGNAADDRCGIFKPDRPLDRPEPPTKGAEDVWRYSDDFIVCRFPGKKIRPLTFIEGRWQWTAPPAPRPILNLDKLNRRPDSPVVIVEGEKAANAAERLLPNAVVTTWPSGCKATGKADFRPLKGRHVALWPDADEQGINAMEKVAEILQRIGAAEVMIVTPPADAPTGWDLADAGWTPQQTTEYLQKNIRPAPEPNTRNRNARWGKCQLNHTRRMQCFDRCVEIQAKRERNSYRRRARLLKVAHDLELNRYINRQEISERVLAAKDEQLGNRYQPLTAADRCAMQWPEVDWLIPGLLPANDLTIIGGRPKVGKTALAMAIAAALRKQDHIAGFLPPAQKRPVIIISDDQGDADTKSAMEDHGIFHDPGLIWSRRFRLTEADIDGLLSTIKQNPGAAVVMDSLRSVARSQQYGENDPEVGAVIYDLKAAVIEAGGSLVLVHHCNKSPGLTGVEALSGHNAIAGAANTVITLHYVEDDKGRPIKEAPQRRVVREGRTGPPLDLVISRTAGTANFQRVSTYQQWCEQAKEVQKEKRRTETQSAVLDFLEGRDGQWLQCREVVSGMGMQWEPRGASRDAKRVREALNRLSDEGEINRERAGTAFVFSCPSLNTPEQPEQPERPVAAVDSSYQGQTEQPEQGADEPGADEVVPVVPIQGSNGKPLLSLDAPVVPVVPPQFDPPRETTGFPRVKGWLSRPDSGDDPHWGPQAG